MAPLPEDYDAGRFEGTDTCDVPGLPGCGGPRLGAAPPKDTVPVEELVGQVVEVYRNLNNGLWSVKVQGKVRAYAERLCLEDARFVVQEGGRQRVLKEKRKAVHAWVKGTLAKGTSRAGSECINYNPYVAGHFFPCGSPKTALIGASRVCFDVNGDPRVVASGLQLRPALSGLDACCGSGPASYDFGEGYEDEIAVLSGTKGDAVDPLVAGRTVGEIFAAEIDKGLRDYGVDVTEPTFVRSVKIFDGQNESLKGKLEIEVIPPNGINEVVGEGAIKVALKRMDAGKTVRYSIDRHEIKRVMVVRYKFYYAPRTAVQIHRRVMEAAQASVATDHMDPNAEFTEGSLGRITGGDPTQLRTALEQALDVTVAFTGDAGSGIQVFTLDVRGKNDREARQCELKLLDADADVGAVTYARMEEQGRGGFFMVIGVQRQLMSRLAQRLR